MNVELWWVWIIMGVVFIILEIFTAGFFILWFGIGAIVAGIEAYFNVNIVIQCLSFVVVSSVLLAATRKLAERFSGKQPPGVGADRLIGEKGVVLEEIDNIKNTGRVRVEEDEWRAESITGEVILKSKIIEVVKLEGTRLVVKNTKEVN